MSIRVALIDDHQIVLDGLRSALASESDIEIIGIANSGRDGVELCRRLTPDVVVLDVTMPGMNGLECLRQIHAVSPDTEVVALSMHAGGQVARDMLAAGASSYVLKAASIQNLITAIRTVVTGQTYLPPELAGLVPQDLVRQERGGRSAPGGALTDREKQVLSLVAEGKSSKEVAAEIFISTKTVVWHRQSIMDKLAIRSVAELTKYAVRAGLTPLDQ